MKKLVQESEARFEGLRKEVLSHSTSEPQPADDGRVEASWGKVQDMLTHEKSLAEHLAAYRGELPGLGHVLGPNPAVGPMAPEAERTVIEVLRRVSR